jgi:hypothetical protein
MEGEMGGTEKVGKEEGRESGMDSTGRCREWHTPHEHGREAGDGLRGEYTTCSSGEGKTEVSRDWPTTCKGRGEVKQGETIVSHYFGKDGRRSRDDRLLSTIGSGNESEEGGIEVIRTGGRGEHRTRIAGINEHETHTTGARLARTDSEVSDAGLSPEYSGIISGFQPRRESG